jgi:type VI protein secretion system component Hcp
MIIYSKFDTLKGDVTTPGYEDNSKLMQCSYGVSNLDPCKSGSTNTRRASKVEFDTVVISKEEDAASIQLIDAANKHSVLNTVELAFLNINDNNAPTKLLNIVLSNVRILSHIQETCGQTGLSIESYVMSFSQFKHTATQFNTSGKAVGQSVFEYNLETGQCS